MTADDIEQRWPDAVTFARKIREAFGDDLQLAYALDKETGAVLKRRGYVPIYKPK